MRSLRANNWRQSINDKNVSRKTMLDRSTFLVAFFRTLRHETEFKDANTSILCAGGKESRARTSEKRPVGRAARVPLARR
jgi:hypothetical protein